MSNIDYRQHFLHAVSGLRTQGLSTSEIIALVIGDTLKPARATAAPETERLVSLELANGMTKLVPASSVPAKANTHAVTNAPCLVEWVKPEGFVPDVIPDPAPKPVVVPKQEIVFVKSRGTTHDMFNERYEETWVPPVGWEQPTPAEKAEVGALSADAEREIAEMEATLATRRAEYAQFKTSMAGSDATK